MVPIVMPPPLSRENDETRLRVVVPVLSTESQFWPEKLAPLDGVLQRRLELRDFSLDLGAIDARSARGDELVLDLAGDVDRRVEACEATSTVAEPRPRASVTVESALRSERIVVAIDQ